MKEIMKSKSIIGLASLLVVSAVTGSALISAKSAMAQTADPDKKISLNFQNAPIQTVLKTLFASVTVNNSIDSDVQGNVNITMNDVGFDVALRSLLHAANPPLTYDLTDGVYHVKLKKHDLAPVGVQISNTSVSSNPSGADYSGGAAPAASTGTDTGKRFYRLPIDHFDATSIVRYLSGQPGIYIVSSGGTTGQNGNGGGNQGNQNSRNGQSSGFGGQSGQSGGFGGQSSGFGGQNGYGR